MDKGLNEFMVIKKRILYSELSLFHHYIKSTKNSWKIYIGATLS